MSRRRAQQTVLEATRAELAELRAPAALAAAALVLAKDVDENASVAARVLLARELRITMGQARALRSDRGSAGGGDGQRPPASAVDEVKAAREKRRAGG